MISFVDFTDSIICRCRYVDFGFSHPGNERVKETKSSGELFTESQNINKSLLTLGKRVNYKILLIQIVAVGQIYNLLYR